MNRYIVILLMIILYFSPGSAQTLEDYYRIAAGNNPGLKAVYKKYEAALQKVPQVTTLPDPTFSFGYFISPVETRLGPQQAKFSLTQMFPWFGSLKAQGDAAALLAEARFENFIDARNRLYFQVASAYYPLYELKDQIRIEEENISILESYKSIATNKFENGTGTLVDVLRVDLMLKEAQTNLEILHRKEKPLTTVFNKLLNRPEKDRIVVSESLSTIALTDHFRKDSLLTANPKIKALYLKAEASKATEIAARKQGMPDLGVGLDYVMVGERSDISLPGNGKNVIMPMVSVSIPLFRKKYNAAVEEARLMQESYLNQKLEVENSLIAEYEMVWFEIQQQKDFLSLYEKQIKITKQSLNLLYSAYANSGQEFEEVLRITQELLKYRRLHVKAMTRYQVACAKINYLTSKTY